MGNNFADIPDQPTTFSVDHDSKGVVVQFSESRQWIRLSAQQACDFAEALAQHAVMFDKSSIVVPFVKPN